MVNEEKESASIEDVEIEALSDEALETVAGGFVEADCPNLTTTGPLCCSCSNCSPAKPE